MRLSRRQTIILGAAALGSGAVAARAETARLAGDTYPLDAGELVIHPVEHASFVMATPELVLYNDPVGGAAKYRGLPPPALVLVTHEHPDHFDVPTLQALVQPGARLLVNPSVHAKLPAELQAVATAIGNGETTTANGIPIDAIPAYNLTPDRLKYHPKGRDNGYLLRIGGRRIYIAGDTEDTPEMRAMTDVDIAFLPMNLPYTMSIEQAAAAVAAFQPTLVYPYHYKGSDIDAFAALVGDGGAQTKVVRADWYPG